MFGPPSAVHDYKTVVWRDPLGHSRPLKGFLHPSPPPQDLPPHTFCSAERVEGHLLCAPPIAFNAGLEYCSETRPSSSTISVDGVYFGNDQMTCFGMEYEQTYHDLLESSFSEYSLQTSVTREAKLIRIRNNPLTNRPPKKLVPISNFHSHRGPSCPSDQNFNLPSQMKQFFCLIGPQVYPGSPDIRSPNSR